MVKAFFVCEDCKQTVHARRSAKKVSGRKICVACYKAAQPVEKKEEVV